MQNKQCPICARDAQLLYTGLSGYQEGTSYNIFECPSCKASFADPLVADGKLYEFIYCHAEILAGYERYHRYARMVRFFPRPLALLASAEPSYWSVVQELQKDHRPKKDIHILEIGSGLGYLTYALNRSGYQATGVDISHEAVQSANARYGNFFHVKDLFAMPQEAERYDVVLMMDVLEHVQDPVSFVRAAASLLKENGKLLITTPNKTAAPSELSVWQSDVPPVHLWFMAESTLREIATQAGCSCLFVDFNEFNKNLYSPSYGAAMNDFEAQAPKLDIRGEVTSAGKAGKRRNILLVGVRYLLSYVRRRIKSKIQSSRSTVLCAVFRLQPIKDRIA